MYQAKILNRKIYTHSQLCISVFRQQLYIFFLLSFRFLSTLLDFGQNGLKWRNAPPLYSSFGRLRNNKKYIILFSMKLFLLWKIIKKKKKDSEKERKKVTKKKEKKSFFVDKQAKYFFNWNCSSLLSVRPFSQICRQLSRKEGKELIAEEGVTQPKWNWKSKLFVIVFDALRCFNWQGKEIEIAFSMIFLFRKKKKKTSEIIYKQKNIGNSFRRS